jgi:prepilin-type processing-associated H-X9-DG protein
MSYYYQNGATSANGYVQWSGLVYSYVDNNKVWVCPSHEVGGWAPTCFSAASGAPAGQTSLNGSVDIQVPRLSYVANELLIPRKKYGTIPQQCVPLGTVRDPAETIMIAEYSSTINSLLDSSPTGGDALKTHRPTNAVKLASGGVFDGETYVAGTRLVALTPLEARTAIDTAKTSSAVGKHHICYVNDEAHNGGSNYIYADGHAKFMKLSATLDPLHFQWGKRAYSCPGQLPVLQPDGVTPVQ